VVRRARDNGGPAVAAQVLLYPVTDADFERPSYKDPQLQPLLTAEMMRWYWNHYQPDGAQRSHPDASPLRAQDLRGLPPALLITAECDPLRDEGEAYAARLVAAGVPTQFERYAGQFHGFASFVNMLPGSAAAIEHIGRFIDERLAR
jgi:acetyl esterase